MKYLKSLVVILIIFIPLTLISSIVYYFDIVGNIYSYISFFIPAISLLGGGIYLGRKTEEKGWQKGLILGSSVILFLILISFFFTTSFSFKRAIYYLILLLITTLGSMLGIKKT